MENHPIPQDVTGFQFRLIGNMTVKQFAYLAVPGIIIVLIWYLPVFILIKAILIPFFGLTGLALAFVPIEGRPLDLMAENFLKALVSPNQYIFQKNGGNLSFLTLSGHSVFNQASQDTHHPHPEEEEKKRKLMQSYFKDVSKANSNPLDTKENQFISTLFNTAPSQQASPQPITPTPLPVPAAQQPIVLTPPPAPLIVATPSQMTTGFVTKEPVHIQQEEVKAEKVDNSHQVPTIETENALEKQALEIQHELEVAKIKEATQHSVEEGKEAHVRVVELDKKLQDILSEKQKLEDELVALKKQLGKDESRGKTPMQAVDNNQAQRVRKIPQSMSKNAGMPTPPDVPNLLMGIVKDPRGNVLPNILVEVRDPQGNSVRAFKTNPIGQFASATTLQNGVYTLAFEDPQKQHKFELIELTVNDQIIQPLEIISVDAREELRQQLFS